MNLNEDISRIKELMGVQTLNEQSDYMMDRRANALMNTTGVRSDKDYKEVEQVINKAQNPYKEQINFLDKIPSQRIKRVALLFPKKNWGEEIGSWVLNKLGVVSGWFRTLAEALGYVKKLEEKGVVTSQLVIGSHGGGGELLVTQRKNYHYDNGFLLDIKKIIDSKTMVFFTACEGADYLEVLKDAAEKLGVGAYGAAGLYNYITQSSEKGFYWCSAKPVDQNLLKGLGMSENKPLDYLGGKIVVRVPITVGNESQYQKTTGTIKFKNNALFGIPMTDINFPLDGILYSYNRLKKAYGGVIYEFNLWNKFSENFPKDRKDKLNFSDLVTKVKKTKNINLNSSQPLKQLFDSNMLSVELNLPSGKVDIKNLKQFNTVESLSNKFLLQNKYCMKVDKPPINWIDEVIDKVPLLHLAVPGLTLMGKGYSKAKETLGF